MTEKVVETRRQLATVNPIHLPELARSLNDLGFGWPRLGSGRKQSRLRRRPSSSTGNWWRQTGSLPT